MPTDSTEQEILPGPERGESVEIVPYDPAWPVTFAELHGRLVSALGDVAVRIDHVGSTAVPGLAAKPVIDIQVSVPRVEDEVAYRSAIESIGVGLRMREQGHRYFRPPPPFPRVVQVHVCEAGSSWERDHLLFRDYLRAHPERAVAYAALKHRLAPQFGLDRIGYTLAKEPFIRETLELAERWAAGAGWRVN
jgi:GrpB-like predicted nucleotidyltransferase (UPF0157 family)